METKNAQQRFTERFKIEAVKPLTERGHPVAEAMLQGCVSQPSPFRAIQSGSCWLPPVTSSASLPDTGLGTRSMLPSGLPHPFSNTGWSSPIRRM